MSIIGIKNNLTGKQFNAWTVIELVGKDKWKCKCQCGTVKTISGESLRLGTSKSCGCSSWFNLIGKKIGRLTVLQLYDTKNGVRRMSCHCDCGNKCVINLRDLKKKNPTKSCGCLQDEQREKVKRFGQDNLANTRIGKWTVLYYVGQSKWHCRCDCGNETDISTSSLNSGNTKSCGKCYENTVNSKFFDNIDTEEKAYILGLLYADGYNNEDRNLIRLDLQLNDIDILIKIKKVMNYEGEIRQYQNKDKVFNVLGTDKSFKCKPTARLLIHNSELSKQLALKGCVNNKTYTLTFPNKDILDERLYRHFIRGLIDGDGCIGYWIDNKNTGHEKFNLGLTGTTEIVNSVSNILRDKFDCNPDIRSRFPDRDNNNVQMTICGNKLIERILNWIYKDSTIYLDRKYQKYIELLKQNQKVDGKKLDERKGIFAPRKVINLLNNKIYESCSEAGRCLDVKSSTITFRCKSKKSFVFYYDDYILMSTQEKLDLINNIKGNIDYKEVANY